jgi:hypothetical protein
MKLIISGLSLKTSLSQGKLSFSNHFKIFSFISLLKDNVLSFISIVFQYSQVITFAFSIYIPPFQLLKKSLIGE